MQEIVLLWSLDFWRLSKSSKTLFGSDKIKDSSMSGVSGFTVRTGFVFEITLRLLFFVMVFSAYAGKRTGAGVYPDAGVIKQLPLL